MEAFIDIKSKAAPLDRVNVDTDQIIPKQFLKLVSKTGFGKFLFYDWRFDGQGRPRPGFVLNDPKYDGRQILLARDNFGSGSSREHAVWALLDYGFRCVIAPSFADIFYSNCFKNGILPLRLRPEDIDYLFANDELEVEVNLHKQLVSAGGRSMAFEVDAFRKRLLLEGLDSIGLTLQLAGMIDMYEKQRRTPDPSPR
jgi:3-isopropylmalate/(R)-2-methylmalate dehydratase small subunit